MTLGILLRAFRVAAVGVVIATGAQAQSLSSPSELPPDSFAGTQFVDSRGCVFSRAAINGSVIWVPRVTADSQQVCGTPPSLASAPRQVQAVPRPAPAPVRAQAAPAAKAPRIVPRHVHDNRQNTRTAQVPRGYRTVWSDDRLNPYRAEMTLTPSRIRPQGHPPRGFRAAWDDERLNSRRGLRTEAGDAQTDRIWTRTVPRSLRPVPTQVPVVTITRPRQNFDGPFWKPPLPDQTRVGPATVTRLSTRSGETRFRPQADR